MRGILLRRIEDELEMLVEGILDERQRRYLRRTQPLSHAENEAGDGWLHSHQPRPRDRSRTRDIAERARWAAHDRRRARRPCEFVQFGQGRTARVDAAVGKSGTCFFWKFRIAASVAGSAVPMARSGGAAPPCAAGTRLRSR